MKSVLVLQHASHETLGSLEDVFAEQDLNWDCIPLYVKAPPRFAADSAAGMVVLGGSMSVDDVDKYPFLQPEVEWIREALREEIPLLGICLGAQLLAKAAGARVYANERKEIGWYEIERTPEALNDPLFSGCDEREVVFEWHGDTFDLPQGAALLARSQWCRHQAFRYGRCAWGLQFHVEMTVEMVERWLDHPESQRELENLEYIDPQAIRAGAARGLAAMGNLGQRVLPRFARLCRERSL